VKLFLPGLNIITGDNMAFDEKLNDRIRESLSQVPNVEEKYMFGGSCYMVDGKMCVGVVKDEMMCRIDHDIYEKALEKPGCREMVFTGKPMKGYVFVSQEGLKSKKEFDYWISLCLDFNKKAKASKKKR
jgi:TfoX/Sxy family transcriptional regulator of competence genes